MKTSQISETLHQKGISCPDLLESMSDGVAVYEAVDDGQDFVFCEHNPAAEQITGIPRELVIGRRVTEVFPGVEKLGLLDVLRRVFASGNRENHPTSQYEEEGLVLWVENSVFKLPDGKIVAVYRDITEHKRAEAALSQANRIINRSPVVAFLWENQEGWPVQFVSENSVDLFGYSATEFMEGEISYDQLVHSEDLERVSKEVTENSVRTELDSFVHAPYRVLTKNGEIKWIHDTTSIRRNSHGEISHFEGMVNDITVQQKQQERIVHLSLLRKTALSIQRHLASVKDNQQLIQAICDVFVDEKGYRSAWIVLFDEEQHWHLAANAGLLKDFGVLEQEIRKGDMPPCITRTKEGGQLIWQTSQQSLCAECSMANGYPDAGLMAAPLLHGKQFYGVLTVSLGTEMVSNIEERELFEEMANDIAFALYSRQQDLERQRQEKALQVALDEYADLYNHAPDMFVSVEAGSAKIQQCNQTLLDVLGYKKEELIGKTVYMLYHPDSQQECREEVFPAFCKTGRVINRELTLQRRDGSNVPVTLDVTAIRDPEGNIIQSRSILHDISEKKRLEAQVLISEKMSTIAGLAAGVAHEINTPLSGILQSIQLIEMGLDPTGEQNLELAADSGIDLVKVQDYLQKKDLDFFLTGIRDAATTAAAIVANLLQFSRPQESTFVEVGLAELLDRAVSLAKSDYNLKKELNILNVEFKKEYSSDLSQITCMAMEIEQVFINLIKNSCQAMAMKNGPTAPRIILRTKQRGNMAVIELEDNGPGVKEGISHQIFDPFFTTKEVGMGAGLGLSVAYSIICDRHGGVLRVESTPGKGARFVIELPMERTGVES